MIVILYEKSVVFFASFFRNIYKTAEPNLIKKNERDHGCLIYKKALMSKHRKNYILRDINYFVKMSVSTLPNFVEVGSEFESLEVIEITELANAFVRLVSTLIAKVLNV